MPYFHNDAMVLGLLAAVLGLIFYTTGLEGRFWRRFYGVVPPLLLCYFLPALLNWPLGLISGAESALPSVASRYLLPACLVLLCMGMDAGALWRLGPKALGVFLAGAAGVILGGPLALWLVLKLAPGLLGEHPELIWRGLSAIAGSWIGGSANQAAMKEVFQIDQNLFSAMVAVDAFFAYLWMGILLYGVNHHTRLNRWLRAGSQETDLIQSALQQAQAQRAPAVRDYMLMLGIAFGATALAHWGAEAIQPALKAWNADSVSALAPQGKLYAWGLNTLLERFFWIVVIATTIGVLASFSRLRQLEQAGASRVATVFIYFIVATIGMQMNIGEAMRYAGVFPLAALWMLFHAASVLLAGRLLKAPYFFVAVGSQANVGGVASASVVASAFNPALIPVGVALAVLGYVLGTYGGILSAWLMRWVSGGL